MQLTQRPSRSRPRLQLLHRIAKFGSNCCFFFSRAIFCKRPRLPATSSTEMIGDGKHVSAITDESTYPRSPLCLSTTHALSSSLSIVTLPPRRTRPSTRDHLARHCEADSVLLLTPLWQPSDLPSVHFRSMGLFSREFPDIHI